MKKYLFYAMQGKKMVMHVLLNALQLNKPDMK